MCKVHIHRDVLILKLLTDTTDAVLTHLISLDNWFHYEHTLSPLMYFVYYVHVLSGHHKSFFGELVETFALAIFFRFPFVCVHILFVYILDEAN